MVPEGFRAFLGHRALWCFGLTCALFHLGNASMLPLLNQRLAATVPDASPLLCPWRCGCHAACGGVCRFVYVAILALPVRGVIAWAIPEAWANIPVQVLDGLAAGALATPLLVDRYVRGSGRYNTALGLVMTMQDVGAALIPAVAKTLVGAQGHFGWHLPCWRVARCWPCRLSDWRSGPPGGRMHRRRSSQHLLDRHSAGAGVGARKRAPSGLRKPAPCPTHARTLFTTLHGWPSRALPPWRFGSPAAPP